MKRFIVPAIIVVDVPDDRDQAYAEEIAAEVQSKANRIDVHFKNGHYVMLDENLPTVEVPVLPEETEIPGAYPITEMALCEVDHVFLHPNQLYRFNAIEGCPACHKGDDREVKKSS